MAKNLSHWQFEEDDTVAFLPKSGEIRIGLIREIYEDESSDEDDESRDSKRLRPSQVRVEWYPKGTETSLTANKIILLDRALLMGEQVCRRSQPNRVGLIRNVSIRADFLLLPQCQYVVRNISDERINFVNKFDEASSSSYVAYENWAGVIAASSDKLLLKSDEGYQCWLSTSDIFNDLYDCCTKRVQSSSFNTRQWYEGEPVKCTIEALEKAEWLPSLKPPDSFLRRMEENERKLKCTVLKVEPELIDVRWVAALNGTNASIRPPPTTISGQDLERVHKLEHFEHQVTQIGDRIWLEIASDDVVVPYADWKSNFRHELEYDKESAGSHVAQLCAKADSPVKPEDGDAAKENIENGTVAKEEGTGDLDDDLHSVSVDADAPKKFRTRLGVTAHRWKSHWISASTASPKTTTATRKRNKAAHGNQTKASTLRSLFHSKPPTAGEKLAAEAVCVRSYLDIIWQDGELETGVPSADVAYVTGDLDEHLFVPGNFVLLQDDRSESWPDDGYGVVETVDSVNRVATVSWFENLSASEGKKFIRKDQVSVFELIAHTDYNYAPGVLVMKLPGGDLDQDTLSQVGQVLFTDVDGMHVKWINSNVDCVWPEQICRVGDYNAEDDGESDESEGGDSEDTSHEDSDSWSTVSADVSETEMDDEGNNIFDPTESWAKPKDLDILLTKLLTAIDALLGNVLILRKNEVEVDLRQKLASALIGHYSTMKSITKRWFGLDLSFHTFGDNLSICVRLLRVWTKSISRDDEKWSAGGKASHPAKEVTTADGLDAQNHVSGEFTLLYHIYEILKEFCSKTTFGPDAESNIVSSGTSAVDGGWMGAMRTTLRSIIRLLHQQTTTVSRRWHFADGVLPEEDERRFQLTNRMVEEKFLLVQRFLEQHAGITTEMDSTEMVTEEEADQAFLTPSWCSVLELGNRYFEANPRHKRAFAIFDLLALAVLMMSRSVVGTLIRLERRGVKVDGWESTTTGASSITELSATVVLETSELEVPFASNEVVVATSDAEPLEFGVGVDSSRTTGATVDIATLLDLCVAVTRGMDGVQSDGADLVVTDKQDKPNEAESKPEAKSVELTAAVCFELLDSAPTSHKFIGESFDATSLPSRFMKAVRQEMKLLRTSLPPGVFVKAFENRLDLYSCLLVGPSGTPFADGLFFFDVRFNPENYPTEPPLFHFKSFSTDQLNPNLYQDGKVCVSLLGTWSGKDSEVWNPGSNLLQVLVSIQGLILNAKPYFNEAGFETKRAHPESVEKSRRYNELALIRTIESLWKLSANPPVGFENDVRRHLAERGRKLIETVNNLSDGAPCDFPLQPVSQGFVLSAKKQLAKLAQALSQLGF